ncbi:uncharacterized protein LOC143547099 [Bidens hawaiensis]|uniref:uncharacterized protein LOC143547099 n=1 Tax=Bidens hawaiensis TaxID=980011 RepID=UPI00404A8906
MLDRPDPTRPGPAPYIEKSARKANRISGSGGGEKQVVQRNATKPRRTGIFATTISHRELIISMAAAAAASSRALPFHRLTHQKPLPPHRQFISSRSGSGSAATISCRIHGVNNGGGVSDDSVSTNSFYREFSVIANLLKQIEPLDTSVISKGVSDSVKDSMKRMVSSMLGLLPSDQLSVVVRVSKRPLVRLLASSLITGYTLWNAEYRVMLMRSFESSSMKVSKRFNSGDCGDAGKDQCEDKEKVCDQSVEMEYFSEELERLNLQSGLADLSPDAMNYIQELESELSTAKKDLHTQKQETMQIGHAAESNNDILKYLRSLDSDGNHFNLHICILLTFSCDMFRQLNELSKPSSSEVKRILQQLVHCASTKIFKKDLTSGLMGDSLVQENYKNDSVNFCETRDHLAKLLFWCMLLGHHLRGFENRLYLRYAVGFV